MTSGPYIDAEIAEAFVNACEDELQSLKPGNVHVYSDGRRMTVEDFRKSAKAAAPFIARRGARVGKRIDAAVEASLAAAGQNTNLGIILLCAPLAYAASLDGQRPLQDRLHDTLTSLTVEDAASTFQAIARANPGGLGEHKMADVRKAPTMGLLQAMRLASGFDRVARAYVTDFEDIFTFGLSRLRAAQLQFSNGRFEITALYLAFLAAFPDSHILRKFGEKTAESVRTEALDVQTAFEKAPDANKFELLIEFDASLKRRGLNPGTSADLTVATLFAEALMKIDHL